MDQVHPLRVAPQTGPTDPDSLLMSHDSNISKVQPSSKGRKMVRMAEDDSLPHQNTSKTAVKDTTIHTARSPSIPIHHSRLKRTNSELRLEQEEELADFRDYVFFSRLVQGISQHHHTTHDHTSFSKSCPTDRGGGYHPQEQQQKRQPSEWLLEQNDRCLAHIIGTRNGSLDDQNQQHKQIRSSFGGINQEDMGGSYSSPPASQDISASTTLAGEVFVLDW